MPARDPFTQSAPEPRCGTDRSPRTVYAAPTVDAAEARFAEFETEWGERYPAIIRLWRISWEQFTPFLGFPPEIRKVIYTTNAVESPNARFRQATRRRGHFPNELCALKVLYLVIRNPDANRTNVTGHTTGGKAALNHGGRTSGSVGQAAGHRWA